jgi:hypothetical protein
MPNLQTDGPLNETAQLVHDPNGNTSPLALSTEAVGIGTKDPAATLDVAGGIKVSREGAGAVLVNLSSERSWAIRQLGTGAGTALELASVGGGGNKNLIISTTGRVGVGTTTPASKLHVVGGPIHVSNDGDGAVLLVLDSERGWVFRQRGTGASTALELTAASASNNNKNFIINTDGKVGIGTTAPSHKLHVEGSVRVTDDIILDGADCAEEFDIDPASSLEPGTVMVIGPEQRLRHCNQPYDRRVAGIVSGAGDRRPGVVLGRRDAATGSARVPLALTGTVHCTVDATASPIEVGDLLTTSSTPGHAMRAVDPARSFGAIVGKALDGLRSGIGMIPVLVTLH